MNLQSAKLSTKIATGLDVLGTLFVEHIGITYKLPFYHPAILGTVVVLTYGLFKWKEETSYAIVYSYHKLVRPTVSKAKSMKNSIKVKLIRRKAFKNRNRQFFAN